MQLVAFVRKLFARRKYPCPRCQLLIPRTVAKCYRCGWRDASTTANLEAAGGFFAERGQGGAHTYHPS